MMPALADALQSLGLRHTAAHLDDVVALATKRRWSPTQLLEHLAELELQERTRRSLARRLPPSPLGRSTPTSTSYCPSPPPIAPPPLHTPLPLPSLSHSRTP